MKHSPIRLRLAANRSAPRNSEGSLSYKVLFQQLPLARSSILGRLPELSWRERSSLAKLPDITLHRGEADVERPGGFALHHIAPLNSIDDPLLFEVFGVGSMFL